MDSLIATEMTSSRIGYNISKTDSDWLPTTPGPIVPDTANNVLSTTFKIKVIFSFIGVAIVIVSIIVYMITCYKSTPNKKKCQELEEKRIKIKLLPLSDQSVHQKEPIRHKSARMQRLNSVRSRESSVMGEGGTTTTPCGYMCSASGTSSTLVSTSLDELQDITDDLEEVKVEIAQVEQCHSGYVINSSLENELVPVYTGKDSIHLLEHT